MVYPTILDGWLEPKQKRYLVTKAAPKLGISEDDAKKIIIDCLKEKGAKEGARQKFDLPEEFQGKNYYEILGISQKASTIEIEEAYKHLFNVWNSRVNNPKYAPYVRAVKEFLLEAKNTILDPTKRKEYNESLKEISEEIEDYTKPPDVPNPALLRLRWRLIPSFAVIFGLIGAFIPKPMGIVMGFIGIFLFSFLMAWEVGNNKGFVAGISMFLVSFFILRTIFVDLSKYYIGGALGCILFSIPIGLFLSKPLCRYQNTTNKNLIPSIWVIATILATVVIISETRFKEHSEMSARVQIPIEPTVVYIAKLEKDLNEAFRKAELNDVSAEVNRALKATLKGTVNDPRHKMQALNITKSFKEIKKIKNEILVAKQPLAPAPLSKIDLAKLEGDINRALRNAGLRGVTSEVNDNLEVTLKGSVGSEYEKDRAFQITKGFKEVEKIKDVIFVVE